MQTSFFMELIDMQKNHKKKWKVMLLNTDVNAKRTALISSNACFRVLNLLDVVHLSIFDAWKPPIAAL